MALAFLASIGSGISTGQTEDSGIDDQGAQVLTRGPVHEAFAEIVSYNPEPGVVVGKAPPEPIEEVPPEIRPAGDNISWIPGYWGWDDERDDYLWISGTWRSLPPGRQWTTGYWSTTGQHHQWISGYWAESSAGETAYLPKPPATVEAGPNTEAPSGDHAWTPGSWVWNRERYAWRPGYWAEGRSDWDWIPAHYVWTPRGYVFVDGYWDYSFERRGVLYAPVYFQSGYRSRPGYSYSPVIAIGLAAVMEHLFLRPNYHHYYFGDYYDRRYRDGGYYSPRAYQSSRHGHDPVYSYRRWAHRQDRDWERRDMASYEYRRDHESARPPRTWADQKRLGRDPAASKERHLLMAAPFEQMAKRKDSPVRVEAVSVKEKRKLADLSRDVRKLREQRRTLEAEGGNPAGGKTGREIKPTKVKLPASPIVGRSPDRFPRKQAPPKPRQSPAIEPERDPPGHKPESEKARPEPKIEPGPREPQTRKDPPASRHEADPKNQKPKAQPSDKPPREKPEPKAKEPGRDSPAESRQPGKDAPAKAREESKPNDTGKHNQESGNPSSGKKSEPAGKDSEQPTGKARKKERN